MENEQFKFITQDGLSLFGRLWKSPSKDIKGVVNLVHGIGEHSGRYAHIAKALNESGYHLAAFDLRGHGISEGKRGFSPSLNHLMDDIELFLHESHNRLGQDLPVYLYGHSLGANLVLNYGLRRKPQVSGVIATGPSFALAFEPPKLKLFLGKILANIWPTFTMSNELEQNALSRDQAIVKAYQDDVFVHDRISARLTIDIIESGQYALAHAEDWTLPLLLMHGTADRITSSHASEEFAKRSSQYTELVLYKDCYHEIHNDLNKEIVIEKMISWLDERTTFQSK
jgi:alpha-beta hydrolase superfamily lysophospholipase